MFINKYGEAYDDVGISEYSAEDFYIVQCVV